MAYLEVKNGYHRDKNSKQSGAKIFTFIADYNDFQDTGGNMVDIWTHFACASTLYDLNININISVTVPTWQP